MAFTTIMEYVSNETAHASHETMQPLAPHVANDFLIRRPNFDSFAPMANFTLKYFHNA